MPLIYIILINYNGYSDTLECVKSLKNIKYANYKVIIVDNNSTDNSLLILKNNELTKECIIIESDQNLGFAGGNNLGIKYALQNGIDYIMLLNNDTLVEPDFLNTMLNSFYKDSKIGLVGCKIMYYPEKNRIWYGGGDINWSRFTATHYKMREIDDGQCEKEAEINFMTGCCMLIKKEVFKNIGLLDEAYFMYYEDVDFCVKVKDSGYKIWYNPKAVIYHKVGFSSGGEESSFSIKWCTRNRLLFMKKNEGKVSKLDYVLSSIFFYITRIIRYLQYKFKKENDKAKAIMDGIRMYKEL